MRWPWHRTPEPWETLIVKPRPVFTGLDEGLRKRTEARREAAKAIRARAIKVETGATVSDVLRRVR